MTQYCPDVFKSVYIRRLDVDNIEVGFCCQNHIKKCKNSELRDVLEIKRQSYLKIPKDPQCKTCWEVEDHKGSSRRQAAIEWYSHHGIPFDNQEQLVSLDWNSDNICNLACITCGPVFSSRWSSEIGNHTWQESRRYDYSIRKNSVVDSLDFSAIQRVYFNGGEPFMSQDHIEILNRIDQQDRLPYCEISYNTNGTQQISQDCLDLLRKARLVRISISIDAIGKEFNYIRWPGKWSKIEKFIQALQSLDFNVILDISCTVGVHNVFSLDKLINWHENTCSHNKQGDPVSLNIQTVGPISHGGKVLSLANISPTLAQSAITYLKRIKHRHNQIDYLIQCVSTSSGDDSPWINYLDELDKKRCTRWQDYLPVLYQESSKLNNSGK